MVISQKYNVSEIIAVCADSAPRVTPRVTEPARRSVWAIEACRCRSNAAAVSRPPEHYRSLQRTMGAVQRTGGLGAFVRHHETQGPVHPARARTPAGDRPG